MKSISQTLTEQSQHRLRVAILWKLRTQRAYTTKEFAQEEKVAPSEITAHLQALIQAGLIVEIGRRKRRYFRVSNENTTKALHHFFLEQGKIESELAENQHPKGMKYCRTCYHHLAGKIGVLLTKYLLQKKYIQLAEDTHFQLSPIGEIFFNNFGIDTKRIRQKPGLFAKACLDFSERKYHLGGNLGKALFEELTKRAWVEHLPNSREIQFTREGKQAFLAYFDLKV